MDKELMRQGFEAYAAGHYLLCEKPADRDEHQLDEYIDSDMQIAWEAWQASREAVVVELPDRDVEQCAYSLGFNSCLKQSRAAIEAQGLKVKP